DQGDLDKDIEKMLAEAKKLLDNPKPKKMKRNPDTPDAPYTPEGEERKGMPKEEDTPEPEKKTADGKPAAEAGAKKSEPMDEEEKALMPALGGEREKIDPRFAKKQR